MNIEYVYIDENGAPATILLTEISKKLRGRGISPPNFATMEDGQLRDERLADLGFFPCKVVVKDIDHTTHTYGGWSINQDANGNWVKHRAVIELTTEQKLVGQRKREHERKETILRDMRDIADPIFMKYQAGEATREEWLAARQMVRDWYADQN